MSKLSMRFRRNGRLANLQKLLSIAAPHVTRAALVVQAGVMESSPVLTGDLRRSWNVSPAVSDGKRVTAKVGTNKVYARYQDKRTRNRGYVKRGIDAKKEVAKQVLRDGVLGDIGQLWSK